MSAEQKLQRSETRAWRPNQIEFWLLVSGISAHPDQTGPPGLRISWLTLVSKKRVISHLRSVVLQVVVDVDGNAWVGGLVVARDRNLWRVSTTTTVDADLGTA